MKKIDAAITSNLINLSKVSPRLRSHHNIHEELSDDIQRLLICLQPGSYVRPHFHPEADKKELIIILQGKCACLTFDESGSVTNSFILESQTPNLACEFPPQKFHSLICLEPDTIVIEVKKGPYIPLQPDCFASWAPAEGTPESRIYLSELINFIKLNKSN